MKIEYDSIEELLEDIKQAKDTFNDKEFIAEAYHMFLQAVQQNAEKDVYKFATEEEWKKAGSPTWTPKDTAEDWFNHMLIETDVKIQMIKERIKRKRELSSFQKVVAPLVEGSRKDDKLVLEDEKEIEETPIEFFEYMEWAAHKQKEAIKKYLKGKIPLSELEIAINEADYEVGKYFASKPEILSIAPDLVNGRKQSDLIKIANQKKVGNLMGLSGMDTTNIN